jgi:hypothetical protein
MEIIDGQICTETRFFSKRLQLQIAHSLLPVANFSSGFKNLIRHGLKLSTVKRVRQQHQGHCAAQCFALH